MYKTRIHLLEQINPYCTYHNVKIGIDVIIEELAECVWTRRDVALQLGASAVSLKVGQYKKSS